MKRRSFPLTPMLAGIAPAVFAVFDRFRKSLS